MIEDKASIRRIRDVLAGNVDKIDQLVSGNVVITGVPTGFPDIDRLTGGLQPGDLIIVAGRPMMGKTSFVCNITENVAVGNKTPVIFFSTEMTDESIGARMLSSIGRIYGDRIRTGQLDEHDWPRFTASFSLLADSDIIFAGAPRLNIDLIRSRLDLIHNNDTHAGLVVVDYLQMMDSPGKGTDNRAQELSSITRGLKQIALEYNIPVIATSQLNRSLEGRWQRTPRLSDFRDSGSIEDDADVIIFLNRPELYEPDSSPRGMAEVVIAKNRNRSTGDAILFFISEYTRFEEWRDLDQETDGTGNGA